MQNVVRNLSYKLATRRPGHDMEAGSMAGTTINSSSHHLVGNHPHVSGNIHQSISGVAPTYRAPTRGVVPSSGMRGALYTNNMRLIVEYREPMHKERMQYDPSNPDEPQVCFQLPLPTEFKPGALISMFILGEPVCAIIQEVSPDDYADDVEGHDGPRASMGKVEWEHGEAYADGEVVQGEDVLDTQDDHDTRLAAPMPPMEPVQPVTITQLSPNRKIPKASPRSNSPIPRKDLVSRKPSFISWLKGPIAFFRRTRVPGPNGRYRENVVVYPDFQRASLAEGGVERMLLGVDGRPVEGGGHEGLDDHGHTRGNPYGGDVILQPLSSSPDGNTSLLTLAAKKILEQDDARIESWAEKHPHRSFPPIPSPAPRYPTFSAVYGGDARLPSRSPSASPGPQPDMDPEPSISSRFKESFSTLRIKYSDSPPPQSLQQDPRLSYSNSVHRGSGIASPIPSPAVSIPRHPGAAQATLQRRDTQSSRRSDRRSEETVQLQPVRRHPSNSNSAPHRNSHRRDTSFDAAARTRAQEEADLRALQRHLPISPVAAPTNYTRQRSLSASGIRNFIGNALSRLSNTPMSPSAAKPPRQRASSMSETASVASKMLPDITVGETDSWRETFEPFKPRVMQRAPTPPLLSSRGPRSPLPLYRAGSGSSKGQHSKPPARPSPPPSRQDAKPSSPAPSYSPAPTPSYAAHPLFPQMRVRTPHEPAIQTQHPSPLVPGRQSANLSMRLPTNFTPMYPHLPSSRSRNVSTLTTDSGASRMTAGGTHTVRQMSRNQSKLKPLPVSPPKGINDRYDTNSGSESDAGYGGTWRSYASPEQAKPTISPHGTMGSRERPDRPGLQAATPPRHNQEPSPHTEGSQHTRFLPNFSNLTPSRPQPAIGGQSASLSPTSNSKDANHPRRPTPMTNLSGARSGYPYVNPPQPRIPPSRPEPPGGHPVASYSPQAPSARVPSSEIGQSISDSTTGESTLDGYQTAPSIPSISDAFDKSSYRADSRTGASPIRNRPSDGDSDSNSDESETASNGDSGESNVHDSDTDREVDTTRHTNGSWAIPAGGIDAYGNERAAILSGNARVYIARPRDQQPERTRPSAQTIFNAAAIATRPTRPDPPHTSPTGHPARF